MSTVTEKKLLLYKNSHIKNTVTEMKNTFEGLITKKTAIAEGRIPEFQDVSIETSKTKKQKD